MRELRPEADAFEEFADAAVSVAGFADAIGVEGFAHGSSDAPAGVDAAEGVLEDGLDASSELSSGFAFGVGDVRSVEGDQTAVNGGESKKASGEGGFPAA